MNSLSATGQAGSRTAVRALVSLLLLLSVLLCPLFSPRAQAQSANGWVQVVVGDSVRTPLSGVIVRVVPRALPAAERAALTSPAGVVVLGPLPAGSATLVLRGVGLVERTRDVVVPSGDTARIEVQLSRAVQSLGAVTVVALRGDLTPSVQASRDEVAAVVPHDAGEVLRVLPGADAMRRGALGLDPVVRGLRDTQLGVYVDAARTFPGGPAGMDTPLSHVDPAHIQSMEVISGPYALTWGAGNLSAIRVTTDALPGAQAAPLRARLSSGYDGNLGAREFAATLAGAWPNGGRVQYSAGGSWRDGNDYRSGDGSTIGGDFRSAEWRGKVGVRTSARGMLSVLGTKQEQRDIDYPGRPLDASYFDSYQLQADYVWRAGGTVASAPFSLRSVELMSYAYDVDHLMDNDDKPTALANPQRTPPFPLRINTWSGVHVMGARAAVGFTSGLWAWQLGGDVYDADHDARRTTDRRDTGAAVRRDLIWGGARIMDAGGYLRGERPIGRAQFAGTVRLDVVRADADSASAFFVQQHGADLSSRESNWSGAATVRLPLAGSWSATAGVGSVVRTAEANERFSDRAAAKRAQTNAEFLGNPQLSPERSTQADFWIEGRAVGVQWQFNGFARRLDDYITLEATDLPRAQAGSPPPVFRFVNGRARYHGGEITAARSLARDWFASAALSYLHGHDDTLDEPALGVTPLRGDLRLRYAPGRAPWWVESAWHAAGAQTRVAITRGERSTAGWNTLDVQGAYTVGGESPRAMTLRAGVRNLLDRGYAQHLTALNAFTSGRIAEPGRVLFVRVTTGF
jgi:iron complex outermembrane recepter protein